MATTAVLDPARRPFGVGKTLLALHFIFAGAASRETGVIATFQENPPSSSGS
jgi:KaiC/GvpD/RAD55 family RecA-like ATPase